MRRSAIATAVALWAAPSAVALWAVPAAAASGPPGHHHGGAASDVGSPAPKGQGRVVAVDMHEYGYNIKALTVKSGEVVRFAIVNTGGLLHEFNLNTAQDHAEHRPMIEMMQKHGMITPDRVVSLRMKMPDGHVMEHIEPNSILLEPGKSGEIAWRFNKPGEYEIACNIPGHYESGMVAKVTVLPR
jgi:uncharacterized cupredoxin-like copper-binding protein